VFEPGLLVALRAEGYTPMAWARYVRGHLGLARARVEARPAAVRSVLATGFTLLALQFAGAAVVTVTLDAVLGRRLFILGATWLSAHCLWVLAHLGLLTDRAGRPQLRLGLPNTITLLRSLTVPWMVVSMVDGQLELGLGLYLLGAVADVADGALARRRGEVTRLGTALDPLVDVAWNSAAALGLVLAGALPYWVLVAIGVRYGLLLVGSAVIYLVRGRLRIRPTLFGKASGAAISATFVLAFLNRLLLPDPVAWRLGGLLNVAIGFLLVATIIYVVVLGLLNVRTRPHAEVGVGRVVGSVGAGHIATGADHEHGAS
jgi:cardiolipin synthase